MLKTLAHMTRNDALGPSTSQSFQKYIIRTPIFRNILHIIMRTPYLGIYFTIRTPTFRNIPSIPKTDHYMTVAHIGDRRPRHRKYLAASQALGLAATGTTWRPESAPRDFWARQQADIVFVYVCRNSYKYLCACSCVHAKKHRRSVDVYIHTCIPTYIHTYIHAYIHTYLHVRIYIYTMHVYK